MDKKGVGSRILDSNAEIDFEELNRLGTFASPKLNAAGESELGLNLNEIQTYMDANFKRAEGHRRRIDRKLMNGEWPVLLKVMGKNGADGRYLSIAEVRDLYIERRLPLRMTRQLNP